MKKSRIIIPIVIALIAIGGIFMYWRWTQSVLGVLSSMANSLADVTSSRTETTVDIDGSFKTEIYSDDIGIDLSVDTESLLQNGISHSQGRFTLAPVPLLKEISLPFENYQQTDEKKSTSYTNINGTGWFKSETIFETQTSEETGTTQESESTEDMDFKLDSETVQGILQKIKEGEIKAERVEGTQMLGEQEVIRLDFSITGDLLGELIKALAESGGGESELPEDFSLEGGDAGVTLYVAKDTRLPAKMVIDCTPLGNVLAQKFVSNEDVSLSANKCMLTVVFKEFNTVKELKIPQEVIDTAVESEGIDLLNVN